MTASDERPDPRLTGLPRSIAPSRDLWPGIEGRLKRRGGGTAGRRVPLVALAVAASVIVTVLLLRPRHPADEPSLATESAQVQATLIATTGPRSSTAHSLARLLSILDNAIDEAEAALDETPGDPALVDLLQTLQRRRLTLLAQAARFAAES